MSTLWRFETATHADAYETHRQALAAQLIRVEAELGAGPFLTGDTFTLVDAAFAPIFRYFDVFDALTDTRVFEDTPSVRAWRTTLFERPSVRQAVVSDYGERLRAFLQAHDAHILKLAA
ncbi:glutathione S-transferase family protein [Trinickia dabaoshanensis]|uniref:glutathione S-transferase family protein n=1 Tax=Trinickia dabaoshanensis TaxID=564714 RepID=UPI0022B89BD0|nr:glutathione S-transferase domain-containing protein [Trinickia dabaoshanensis]